MMSSGMLFSAPYMTTIQPPAPVQNATIDSTTGRWPGAITWLKLVVAQVLAATIRPDWRPGRA